MGRGEKVPMMIDPKVYIAAGIDPKTGLPLKLAGGELLNLKDDILKIMRVVDEQDAISRFEYDGLPYDILHDLIERVIYYRGQGMLFYIREVDKFYFLPFTLEGEIDVYGRYINVSPVPFNGVSKISEDKKKEEPWIPGLSRKVIYDIPETDDDVELDIEKAKDEYCVLLCDYSKQISQTTLPRQILNDPLLQTESEIIPFMRTALMHQTGVEGVKTSSDDEAYAVNLMNATMRNAALRGDRYVGVTGSVDFQELAAGTIGLASDFMQALESLENFRLGTYGIANGGLFQKKAHMLQSEQSAAGGSPGLVLKNCLMQRQKFCDIANKIFGLNLSVRPADGVEGVQGEELDEEGNPLDTALKAEREKHFKAVNRRVGGEEE